jgi:hypothetical protein
MLNKPRLLILALAQLALIAAMQPVVAKPAIYNRPHTVNPSTARASCTLMDGTFRHASGGGWTCKYGVGTGWAIQSCNSKGGCTTRHEPYRN